jgi:phytoene dehydrogenase-like protein
VPAAREYDVTVVGAGHNGLVAAGYLAKAGLDVALIERQALPGGLCRSGDPFDDPLGQGNLSVAAAWSGMLQPVVRKDLGLHVPASILDPQQFYVGQDATLHHHPLSPSERARFHRWRDGSEGLGILAEIVELETSIASMAHETQLLCQERSPEDRLAMFNRLPADLRDGLISSMHDLFARHSGIPELDCVAIAQAAMSVQNGPLETEGGGFFLAYMAMAATGGVSGAWGLPPNGMGAIANALLDRVHGFGVDVHLDSEVEAIELEPQRIRVRAGSDEFSATRALLACGLHQIDTLVGRDWIGNDLSPLGVSAVIYLRLDDLPTLSPQLAEWLAERQLWSCVVGHGPSTLSELSEACTQVREGAEWSDPLLLSATLVGSHKSPVLYVYTQFVGYEVPHQPLIKAVIAQLEDIFPGLGSNVLEAVAAIPHTFASLLGTPYGHPEHLQMEFPALLDSRPSASLADYRLPDPRLYHGSAAAFPGGLVTGLPGRNAALTMLHDFAVEGKS